MTPTRAVCLSVIALATGAAAPLKKDEGWRVLYGHYSRPPAAF